MSLIRTIYNRNANCHRNITKEELLKQSQKDKLLKDTQRVQKRVKHHLDNVKGNMNYKEVNNLAKTEKDGGRHG